VHEGATVASTAYVEAGARVGDGSRIGAGSWLDHDVILAEDVVVVGGNVLLGPRTPVRKDGVPTVASPGAPCALRHPNLPTGCEISVDDSCDRISVVALESRGPHAYSEALRAQLAAVLHLGPSSPDLDCGRVAPGLTLFSVVNAPWGYGGSSSTS